MKLGGLIALVSVLLLVGAAFAGNLWWSQGTSPDVLKKSSCAEVTKIFGPESNCSIVTVRDADDSGFREVMAQVTFPRKSWSWFANMPKLDCTGTYMQYLTVMVPVVDGDLAHMTPPSFGPPQAGPDLVNYDDNQCWNLMLTEPANGAFDTYYRFGESAQSVVTVFSAYNRLSRPNEGIEFLDQFLKSKDPIFEGFWAQRFAYDLRMVEMQKLDAEHRKMLDDIYDRKKNSQSWLGVLWELRRFRVTYPTKTNAS